METQVKVTIQPEFQRVEDAAKKGAYKNLGHAAASIRKEAQGLIEKSDQPSPVGQPVHSKTGRAKQAVLFAVEKDRAVVGFAFSRIGEGMEGHEHGGTVSGRDETFQKRPTMLPALQRNIGRFAAGWSGSVHD